MQGSIGRLNGKCPHLARDTPALVAVVLHAQAGPVDVVVVAAARRGGAKTDERSGAKTHGAGAAPHLQPWKWQHLAMNSLVLARKLGDRS